MERDPEERQLELKAVSTSNAELRKRLYEENLALVRKLNQERDAVIAEKEALEERLEVLNEDIERLTASIDRHVQAAWKNA